VSLAGIASTIQGAVDRARRHGWTVWLVSERDHAVIMEHQRSAWGICITTDGAGHLVIYRL
jgi:hypothetical protein